MSSPSVYGRFVYICRNTYIHTDIIYTYVYLALIPSSHCYPYCEPWHCAVTAIRRFIRVNISIALRRITLLAFRYGSRCCEKYNRAGHVFQFKMDNCNFEHSLTSYFVLQPRRRKMQGSNRWRRIIVRLIEELQL